MFCRNCGKEIPNTSKLTMGEKFTVIITVVIMTVAAAILANLGEIFDTQHSTVSSNDHTENKQPEGLDEELFPFYALLPDKQKVVYEEALACIENGESGFVPSYELEQTTISTILEYIYYDQPQLLWYEPNNSSLTSNTEKVIEITLGYNNLADKLEYNRNLVEDVVERLLNEAESFSELEAERFFHDYLCESITYQSGVNDQNIYSAFVENSLGRLRTEDSILLPACNADDMNYKALYGAEWEYDAIRQLGLDESYVIDSVESFYNFLYSQAITRGIGNHNFSFVVKGSDAVNQIENLSSDEYLYNLIDPVANYLGTSGWSGMSWEYQYYPLWPYDDYFYFEYQLNFY